MLKADFVWIMSLGEASMVDAVAREALVIRRYSEHKMWARRTIEGSECSGKRYVVCTSKEAVALALMLLLVLQSVNLQRMKFHALVLVLCNLYPMAEAAVLW